MNSFENELTWFAKSPLALLNPCFAGSAVGGIQQGEPLFTKEGQFLPLLKGGQEGFMENVLTIVRPLITDQGAMAWLLFLLLSLA